MSVSVLHFYSHIGWIICLRIHSSSGLLIYAALVDLLVEDFLSEEANRLMNKKAKISAFCWVLLGGKYSRSIHSSVDVDPNTTQQ